MTAPEQEEREWINLSVAGDNEAFGKLVLRYQNFAIGIAYRMVGQISAAEDIAQDAFIKAWLHLPSFRRESTFRAWLGRIVSNAAIDHIRKSRMENPIDETVAIKTESPPARAIRGELHDQIRQAVLALPAQCRAALVLREYEEFSYKEIAHALDIPIGTVMSRLNYARSRLREALQPILQENNGTS